jgi:hypothetical protein
MKLQLRRFDMSSIGDDKVVVMIGKRETGKSFLTKDLLWHQRDVPIGTVISATEHANKFYSYIVPSLFIHDEFSPNIVANVLKRQKLIIKKCRKEIKQFGKTNIDPRAFLVLDDCLADANSWVRDKGIRSCFMNGRHFRLFFVLTCQYPLGIPPNLRTNIDYVFILRENLINNRRRIYENYAGMFPTFEIFCNVMDQCTENFEVFLYKAEPHDNFRIGAPEFWALQDECDSDDESDEELFDVRNFKGKKGPVVNVKKSMV